MTSEVILVSANWCASCKTLKKALEGKNYSIPVNTVDADKNPDIIQKYGVRSLPTLIRLDNGVETNRMIGYNALKLDEFFVPSAN